MPSRRPSPRFARRRRRPFPAPHRPETGVLHHPRAAPHALPTRAPRVPCAALGPIIVALRTALSRLPSRRRRKRAARLDDPRRLRCAHSAFPRAAGRLRGGARLIGGRSRLSSATRSPSRTPRRVERRAVARCSRSSPASPRVGGAARAFAGARCDRARLPHRGPASSRSRHALLLLPASRSSRSSRGDLSCHLAIARLFRAAMFG